jgi:hypothetical protein
MSITPKSKLLGFLSLIFHSATLIITYYLYIVCIQEKNIEKNLKEGKEEQNRRRKLKKNLGAMY